MNKARVAIMIALSISSMNTVNGQDRIDSLLSKLNQVLEEEHIPGAMLSIVRSDTVVFAGGIGYASVEKKESVTAGHLFRLGSISKSITAMGIAKLVGKGSLTLDTPIREIDTYLDFKNPWKEHSPITVAQVLEHTAGFDDVRLYARYDYYSVEAPSCLSLLDIHRKSLYARWQPGVQMSYSNPGYVVAGHILECISKQPYAEYLKNEILNPIGMSQSDFYFKSPSGVSVVGGHKYEGHQYQPVPFVSTNGGPAGDLCSTAKDMASFLTFMLNKKVEDESEPILSKEIFDRIEYPTTSIAARQGFKNGYGLGIRDIWTHGYLFHGHDGNIDGFSSIYLYSRDADLALAIAINKQGDLWPIVDKILDSYIEKKAPVILQDNELVSPDLVNKYEGFYIFKNPRNELFSFLKEMRDGINITFSGAQVVVQDLEDRILDTLYYKGSRTFYRKGEEASTMMLLNQEEPAIWVGGSYAERESRWLRKLKNGIFYLAVFMCTHYALIGFFWWVRRFFSKSREPIKSRFILWAASICWMTIPISFIGTMEFIKRPAEINVGSVVLFTSSIFFLLFSIWSGIEAFRLRGGGTAFKIHYRMTAYSLIGMALYLLFNAMIGFKLWAY